MATRYKITFESLTYVKDSGYKSFEYTVCTCLDERKAIVMATQVHMTQKPDDRIHQVSKFERLTGDEAQPTDIVDRGEY